MVRERGARFEWQIAISPTRHDRLDAMPRESVRHPVCDVEHESRFLETVPNRPGVSAAVARVDDDPRDAKTELA